MLPYFQQSLNASISFLSFFFLFFSFPSLILYATKTTTIIIGYYSLSIMLPQHYEELTIRPYGFPPFPVNENGTLIVQQGERFCRVSVGHAICRCKRKFNSTANLRHHINKHEHVRAAPGRNSSTQAKDEAQSKN